MKEKLDLKNINKSLSNAVLDFTGKLEVEDVNGAERVDLFDISNLNIEEIINNMNKQGVNVIHAYGATPEQINSLRMGTGVKVFPVVASQNNLIEYINSSGDLKVMKNGKCIGYFYESDSLNSSLWCYTPQRQDQITGDDYIKLGNKLNDLNTTENK